MCGIAGIIQSKRTLGNNPKEKLKEILLSMNDEMKRRGPDGSGIQIFDEGEWLVGLSHTRLSIIDLEGGAQPLSSSDNKSWVTFNGEIYNFREIRKKLEREGRTFRTHSDSLVLAEGHAVYQEKILKELNGMFALGIWDTKNKNLLLARDRFGIKPLYYMPLSDSGIVFASGVSTLMKHPGCSKKIDSWSLANYFFSDYIHPPLSILQGVFQLPPGHYFHWDMNGLGERKMTAVSSFYLWQLPDEKDKIFFSKEKEIEVATALRNKIASSVERQLISDVPTGVFLSGGLDSSIIAYEASKLNPQIETFSIGFDRADYDESSYASLLSKQIGVKNINRTISIDDLFKNLHDALDTLDSPLADPSLIPTTILSNLTRQHVKVALGGDGGDELFAGYPTYLAHTYAKFYALFGKGSLHKMISNTLDLIPVFDSYQSLEWKIKRFVQRFDQRPDVRHGRWMSALDWPDVKKAFKHQLGDSPIILREWFGKNSDFILDELLLFDFKTYLPGSVLSKVDRASMGESLETRPPFLDNDLAEYVFKLDGEFKFKNKTSKYILKSAYRGLIPDEILFRSKKGFGIPLSSWIKGPLNKRLEGIFAHSPLFDHDGPLEKNFFLDLWHKHNNNKIDASRPLWSLIVLDHWRLRVGAHI